MKNQINPETTVTNQPFFETIFTKHKKVLYALPVVAVALIIVLYITMSDGSKEATANNTAEIDVSLPGAEGKQLTDSKLEVLSDFDKLNEAEEKEKTKGDEFDVASFDANEPVAQKEIYENPNDKKIEQRVDRMMAELNKEKKKQPKSTNSNSYSAPQYKRDNVDPDLEKAKTKDEFDEFFGNRSGQSYGSAAPLNTKQQTDPYIYASIKGDHLRLKNNQRVTLILPKETTINGKIFKKNTLVYAQATFTGNRLHLSINNINQVPMSIKAYDPEDGNLGLQVQQSLIAETSSEAVSDGSDEVDVNGIPLGNTIKKLFKRKQQEPRIDLLNNQKLILKLGQ